MGILSHLKLLLPLSFYLTGVYFVLRGLISDGRWALLMLTLLIPLRNVIERIEQFPLGNQSIDLLIGGAMAGWVMGRIMHNRKLISPSYLNGIIVALVIYTFISLVLGNNYLYGTFGFDIGDSRIKDWKNSCFLMPLLFLITLNHIRDRAWIMRVLMAMGASMLMVAYYTLMQTHEYWSLLSRDKIHGTFQFLGPNEVAAFFNQYTVIIAGIYFCIKNWKVKAVLLAIIAINTVCIVFLYSRAAYLGLLAGFGILFLLKNKKLFVLLILAAIFWKIVLPPEAVQRIEGTTNQYGQLDESSERRILIWQQGIGLFKESPLVGIGYGVFRDLGLDLGDTHNIYIKILVEQGIIGMAIFLLVILGFIRMGYTLYKRGKDGLSRGMGLGLMVSISTLLINNLFGDRWSYFELSAYLWIFAGLVGRLIIDSRTPSIPAKPVFKRPAGIVPKELTVNRLRFYDL